MHARGGRERWEGGGGERVVTPQGVMENPSDPDGSK